MHAVERLDEGECVSFERLKVGSRGEVSCRSSLCQYKTGMLKSNLTVLRDQEEMHAFCSNISSKRLDRRRPGP